MNQQGEARSPEAWSRVTAITVTYNSAAVIAGCLESVATAARVVVVDNASRDDTVAVARAALSHAEIMKSPENLGFGRGNNLALETTKTDFALLVNPDARLRPGALETLVETADRFPEAAIVAPGLVNADGSPRLSHDVPYIRRRHYPRKRHAEPIPEGPFCTWALSGAVMLLRMDAMRQVGFFDPEIFLYFEDNDLCLRAVAAGYILIQEPRAVAEHAEGTSSPPTLGSNWVRNRSLARSRFYFVKKHWGRWAALVEARRLLPRHLFRFLVYGLGMRPKKSLSNLAFIAGALGGITK